MQSYNNAKQLNKHIPMLSCSPTTMHKKQTTKQAHYYVIM